MNIPDTTTKDQIERGEVAASVAAPLKRAWKRTNARPGTYNSSFFYEGSQIFLNTLTESAWKEIEAEEKTIVERGKALAKRQEDFQSSIQAQAKSLEDLADEARNSARAELEAEANAENQSVNEEAKAVAALQNALFLGIIKKTVVGWKDAPEPYSPEAVDDLSLEIVVSWAKTILEKSRLGLSEADFLSRK